MIIPGEMAIILAQMVRKFFSALFAQLVFLVKLEAKKYSTCTLKGTILDTILLWKILSASTSRIHSLQTVHDAWGIPLCVMDFPFLLCDSGELSIRFEVSNLHCSTTPLHL